ncbi:MAG TPA: hypothetical protein VEI54_13365, partial [Candidatus Limnocylindrales bacterium]|nr:hypothetical protein [Candidatus Limnocylindrales bacterium]
MSLRSRVKPLEIAEPKLVLPQAFPRLGFACGGVAVFAAHFLTTAARRYNLRMPQPKKARRKTERRETERRNEASRNLDHMSAMQIVRLMNREDRKVAPAVTRELPAIAQAVDGIVSRMYRGGRLIYVGSGTSGRL